MQIKKEWVIPAAVGVTSFAAGVGAGCLFVLRRVKKEVEDRETQETDYYFKKAQLERQVDSMLRQSEILIKELKITAGVLRKAHEVEYDSILLARENHPSYVEPDVTGEIDEEGDDNVVNIFKAEDSEWDYESELAERDPDKPYIIHRDEFFGEEMDCTQTTITYYAGDNILCDERDTPIYNPEQVVGQLMFGHGSNDPNVVYVRNERLQAEYEILLDHGHYQVEILGQSIDEKLAAEDLKHSRSVLKFRPE